MAYDYADAGEYYGATACTPLTTHRRRCVIWTYMEESGLYCDAYTKIQFRRGSYRTADNGWYRGECSTIGQTEANGDTDGGWKWNWYGPLTEWPTIIQ